MHATTVNRFLLDVVAVGGHDGARARVAVHSLNVMWVHPSVAVTHITVKGFQKCRNTWHTFARAHRGKRSLVLRRVRARA